MGGDHDGGIERLGQRVHDSFSPLGGMVAMFNMMLGEIVFGGVGAGLYGMLLFVLVTVFLAGLMIGRTPEYGQEARRAGGPSAGRDAAGDAGWRARAGGAGREPAVPPRRSAAGPHGLEPDPLCVYVRHWQQRFGIRGLRGGTVYHNLMIAFAMLLGRFGFILPVLAIAGSLAARIVR